MAPIAVSAPTDAVAQLKDAVASVSLGEVAPADLSVYSQFDSTPTIGTEFRKLTDDGKPTLSIREVLADDRKLKALGRLVSERGVVFFRDAEITPDEQLVLVDKLGKFGGKPANSGLHVHPLTLEGTKHGDEISQISNQYVFTEKYKVPNQGELARDFNANSWHSDITFEPVPSDYASLQIRTIPKVGGDTLWASAYEAYDRLSAPYKKFLEGLTALHKGEGFIQLARAYNLPLRDVRGSPDNTGDDLEAVHPVIRTNPVTGWKGLFVNKGFTKRIVELNKAESDEVLDFLHRHIALNQNFQVRFRWEPNNLAIWDNRSTYHAITDDVRGLNREGTRSVSLGERPFLDPNSVSRREDLAKKAAAEAEATA